MKATLVPLMILMTAVCSLGQIDHVPQSRAANLLGVPLDQLQDIQVQEHTFPALGVTVTRVKALDPRSGDVLGGTFDHRGVRMDFAQLRRDEIEARKLNPVHKLQSELAELVATGPQNRKIPVGLWLVFDSEVLDSYSRSVFSGMENATHEQRSLAEQDVAQFVMVRNGETVAPVVTWLRSEGFQPTYVSTSAPAIMVSLTPAEILTVAAHPSVDTIYPEKFDRTDGNVNSHRAHRTDRVHDLGVKGRGIRIAMLENNGIDPACPHLNVTAWFNAGTPNPDNHIHGTSGCVASLLNSRIGASSDVSLYSANAASYSDSNVMAAADWIATQNIDATNMSYGGDYNGVEQMMDRYYDYQSRFYQDSYVASAGNSGLTNDVGSPGTAWNCITVGAFDVNDTGDWSDDGMASFSSAVDPNNGCEKPNVAASGVDVDTLGDAGNGWITNNYDGTSFSAPHTTGNLANAMVLDVTNRGSEAAMATMMASAWHNIEGAARLSEQDGAGGIHGLAAARMSRANHARSVTVNSSSFSTNGYYTYNITLKGGDRTRVCIAWSANANSTYTTTSLDADLDLAIYAGSNQTSGTSYGFSSSFNNNFEIVEFTPPTSGTYTVRINDWSFGGTSERVGICWSQKYTDGASARLEEFTSETSTTAGPTIGQTAYYIDMRAPNSPNAPMFIAPSESMNVGFQFASGMNYSPLDLGLWFDYWYSTLFTPASLWTGSVGTTSSSGSILNHRMELPNWPPLVGYDLHHVGFTGDATLPDELKEITEVHTFTFWSAPTTIAVSDDGSVNVPLPFTFTFYGVNYTDVYVNMNGNLTFGTGDSDFTESEAEFLADQPRIAGLWDDLEPQSMGAQSGNTVRLRSINQGTDQLIVEYINVGEYLSGAGATGANTMRIIIKEDNSILIEYRDTDLEDCIVGISPGNGISASSERDLSSNGFYSSSGAIFEQFSGSGDNFDLGTNTYYFNQLEFRPTSASATSYRVHLDNRY